MTRIVERPGRAGAGGGAARGLPAAPGVSSPLVAAPPKPRRRWGLFAAMVLVVCLGALGNVWLHAATTTAPTSTTKGTETEKPKDDHAPDF